MHTEKKEYSAGSTTFNGYLAYEPSGDKKPAVLVAHDWSGCNQFAREKAEKLAQLGYIGFALDMFGDGKLGATKEEKAALIQPLFANRALLLERIHAAFSLISELPFVDNTKIAAIGFCFGGLCVLDLARSGIQMSGVVSFHGLLNMPENLPSKKINAKILTLHGHDDPMAPPEQVLAFQTEMTNKNADWQMHIYGNTLHAFTNPVANDREFGTVYDAKADTRSWLTMKNFFAEIF